MRVIDLFYWNVRYFDITKIRLLYNQFKRTHVTIVQYLWAINVHDIHEKVINFRANIRFPEMSREQISALTNSSRYCSMSVYTCYFFIYSCLSIYFLRAVKCELNHLYEYGQHNVSFVFLFHSYVWLLSRYFLRYYYFWCIKKKSLNLAISPEISY